MKLFKYETHAHTSEASKCSRITAAELVRFYKKLNYTGICISDHFLNGNTTVPENLPWSEAIDLLYRGYENACAEGKKIGLNVFFAWEYSFKGTHLLTYGLNKEWLLNHPDLLDINIKQYCDLVHADGGFIVHAHPFREAEFIDMIRLLPRKVDAVEVINSCRLDFENKRADEYANNYNLLKSAGSDNHIGQIERLSGIQVERYLENMDDMIKAIKNGDTKIFDFFQDS